MKKNLYLLIVLFFVCATVKAQPVVIPDPVVLNYLIYIQDHINADNDLHYGGPYPPAHQNFFSGNTLLDAFAFQSFTEDAYQHLQSDLNTYLSYSNFTINLSNSGVTNMEGLQYIRFNTLFADVSHNQITSSGYRAIYNPVGGLPDLNISYNLLTSVPSDITEMLDARHNLISGSVGLSGQLRYVYLDYNQITSAYLGDFYGMGDPIIGLSHNLLTDVPTLQPYTNQSSYESIDVSYNNIAMLNPNSINPTIIQPIVPGTYIIGGLNLSHNNLSNLSSDAIVQFLKGYSIGGIDLSYNNLGLSPELYAGIKSYNCSNNNIYCLPKLPSSLTSLIIDSNKVTCTPNAGNFTINGKSSAGYPVCNPTNNVNGCKGFPTFAGIIYLDKNNNGIKDAGEQGMKNMKVNLSNVGSVFTDNNGRYSVSSNDTGNQTIRIIAPKYHTAFPDSVTKHFSRFDTTVNVSDIGIRLTTVFDSLAITSIPINRARPGFSYAIVISYRNTGTTVLSPTVVLSYSPNLNYSSCSNAGAVHNGNTVSFNLSNLQPDEDGITTVYFTVDAGSFFGDIVTTNTIITAGNTLAHDNTRFEVTGSFDPNEKDATPELNAGEIASGKYIDYTIHFQNTGTDTAFNIVIADTLSSKLQANSVQVITSSHNCKTTVNDNKVYFNFSNVLLPDSNVNQLGSNGFVRFRIKPKTSLIAGDSINNKASIYFDYNKGVLTNTATTKIVTEPLIPIAGNVISSLNKGVPNAVVSLSGSTSNTANTSVDGNYNFNVTSGGNYAIKPKKNNDITKNNGVSAIDIIQTQNHILNKTPFTNPYKIIAADVNNDKKVSAIDIIFMKRLILGIDTTFTGNRLWAFVDSAYSFANPANPFPYKDSISYTGLSVNKTNQTFIGIKLGDVDYSWNPAVAKPAKINTMPVELYYDASNLDRVQNPIKVAIRVKNFKDLLGMQYTLNFNSDVYEYVGIENNLLKIDFNDKRTNDGGISFLWADANSNYKTLEDGTVLFELVLKARKGERGVGSSELELSNDITNIEAIDKDFNKHDVILIKDQRQIPKDLYSIYPNPANNQLTISKAIRANNHVSETVLLTDITGKRIMNIVLHSSPQTIDISGLQRGVYILSFEDGEKVEVIKE